MLTSGEKHTEFKYSIRREILEYNSALGTNGPSGVTSYDEEAEECVNVSLCLHECADVRLFCSLLFKMGYKAPLQKYF